jgi:hypothetical protein
MGSGRMTVKDYYNHFKTIYGSIATLLTLLPILSFIPNTSRYLFPPLGSMGGFSKLFTVFLAIVVTLLVYFFNDGASTSSGRGRRKIFLLCSATAFVGLALFLAADLRFVREVEVPSKQTSIIVSVGYDRTPFARGPELVTENDWSLLEARGTTEEEIRDLWTFKSILVARLMLLSSYLVALLSLVAILSFAVLYDKSGPATSL